MIIAKELVKEESLSHEGENAEKDTLRLSSGKASLKRGHLCRDLKDGELARRGWAGQARQRKEQMQEHEGCGQGTRRGSEGQRGQRASEQKAGQPSHEARGQAAHHVGLSLQEGNHMSGFVPTVLVPACVLSRSIPGVPFWFGQ